MEIFSFLLGVLFSYTHHYVLPLLTIALLFISRKWPIVLFYLGGMLLATVHQWWVHPVGVANKALINKAFVQGTIASMPQVNGHKTQFLFQLEDYNHHPASGLIQLAWYNNAPQLQVGQRWQLHVKLKKPRNFLNPGSYDYVNSLRAKHIEFTGYVLGPQPQLMTANQTISINKIREYLSKTIYQRSEDKHAAGIIEALTLNSTTHINPEDWTLFRRTGTTHLFGISGEHIALISGLIFWLCKRLWATSASLCLYVPALYSASLVAFGCACTYALLAGFGPPVQRALIGCFFFTVICLGSQRFTAWQSWRYALFAVLCFEPHVVFMQGFYFSFLAVACLMLTQQRWRLKGFKGALALQLSCLIGLMPLSLFWFSYGSINGFFANLFAIPLVSFFIVPLSLVSLVLSSCDLVLYPLKILSWLIALLFKGLHFIEQLSFLNLNQSISTISGVLALLGSFLLRIFFPLKSIQRLSLLWFVLAWFPARELVREGEALIQVLDVGQGLAVNIQTQNHALLYDTGDQFFKGSDLGTMVILPFYRMKAITKLDAIVISHPDKDHRGGLKSVEEEIPVAQLIVNNKRYYRRGDNCHKLREWQWDGVSFRFFPIKKNFKGKNNSSCILQIRSKQGSMLLTGDIEKEAEDYLIQTYGNQLASDLLLIPHHASKSSSSYRFLLEVAPKHAIASLGFANRFRFPHQQTVARLKHLAINFYRTDECGMVEMSLGGEPKCFSASISS